ncbi:MAG: hypothetical protein NWF05_02150 [Candidatus Bathyarchaeota archaeon]|nr:hypothetical protein [Candidatus Bathyarchaeota archaeon]
MLLEIESEAAKLLIKVLLSCQCPISLAAEKEIIQHYHTHSNGDCFDFKQMLDIVGESCGETAFHRLRDFCVCSKNDSEDEVITKGDIYSHFCSVAHWNMAEDALASSYAITKNCPITDHPTWLVGHMLLPVKVKEENNTVNAEYSGLDFTLQLLNIFFPPEIEIETDAFYAIHFASVISKITPTQSKMINQQLESIDRFIESRKQITRIDYAAFQKYGNYRKFCKNRYCKYFQ